MKLVSINIELNKHYETVLNFLEKEKPDVVCLQELLEEDFEKFKKELNLEGVFQPFKYVRGSEYLDTIGRRHGLGIFAEDIIDSGFVFYLGKEENIKKSFENYILDENNTKNSVLLWADVKDGKGNTFKFITTHPPVTREGEPTPFQLEVFTELLKALSNIPEFVLCGDTNAPRGNKAFEMLAQKYKDNIPKEYKTSIDQNLHRVKNIQFMVDGLFTTDQYIASSVRLVDGISDHMAIVADVQKVS